MSDSNCYTSGSKGGCPGPDPTYQVINEKPYQNGLGIESQGYYQLLAKNILTCSDGSKKGCTGCDKPGDYCNDKNATCEFTGTGTLWGVYKCPNQDNTGNNPEWLFGTTNAEAAIAYYNKKTNKSLTVADTCTTHYTNCDS